MDSIFINFFDRIYKIDGIFFACGASFLGRRLLYPCDPVDPVQLLFKRQESVPLFCPLSSLTVSFIHVS